MRLVIRSRYIGSVKDRKQERKLGYGLEKL